MRPVIAASALILIAFAGTASAAGKDGNDGALERYIQHVMHAEGPLRFQAANVDLDGLGIKEVVVHVVEPAFCGTGGCNTLILERRRGGYRKVTDITVTRLPIRVLASRSHGWNDLGVTVGGGGILRDYEARLRFDGRSYPQNPTIAPAEPLARVTGRVILAAPPVPNATDASPTAMQVLRHLDLTSFPNSVGPRRVTGRRTPKEYGFKHFTDTKDGASAELSSRRWIISIDSLVSAGIHLNACFRDQAEGGGTYSSSVPLSLSRGSDGLYAAKIEGAGLGLTNCPSPEPPVIH